MKDRVPLTSPGEQTPSETSEGRRSSLATAGFVLGTLIVCLAVVEQAAGLPFRMPRSWYVDRPLWYFLAVTSFVVGWYLLRYRRERSASRTLGRPGVRFGRVVLYTRQDCHLCDQAKDTLLLYRAYLPRIEEIDVDADPNLAERFGTCVPVVEIDGTVRFRGEVNEVLLRRLIEGTPPRQTER